MTTLLIAMGALIAAMIVRAALDPWAPPPATREPEDQAGAEARERMMQIITPSSFWLSLRTAVAVAATADRRESGKMMRITLSRSEAIRREPRQPGDDAAAIGIAAAVALSVPLWGVIGLLVWWFLL